MGDKDVDDERTGMYLQRVLWNDISLLGLVTGSRNSCLKSAQLAKWPISLGTSAEGADVSGTAVGQTLLKTCGRPLHSGRPEPESSQDQTPLPGLDVDTSQVSGDQLLPPVSSDVK